MNTCFSVRSIINLSSCRRLLIVQRVNNNNNVLIRCIFLFDFPIRIVWVHCVACCVYTSSHYTSIEMRRCYINNLISGSRSCTEPRSRTFYNRSSSIPYNGRENTKGGPIQENSTLGIGFFFKIYIWTDTKVKRITNIKSAHDRNRG